MFAQKPTIPAGAESKLSGAEVEAILESDGQKRQQVLVADLVRRSSMLAITHLHAGLNLHIAQHRDYHRYMSLYDQGHPARSTGHKPGSFVLVWQKPKSKIEAKAKPVILQVVDTLDSGVVLLRGSDGALVKSQASHLAPCPVQVHPMVDVRDRTIPSSLACQICGSKARAASMLVCDHCNKGYHMSCLKPPLKEVPEGDWYCPICSVKRAAPTAQDLVEYKAQSHEQEVNQNTCPSNDYSKSGMIELACQSHDVCIDIHFSERIIRKCNPESEDELHAVRTPAELEKEQHALLVRFARECNPVQQRDVHATSSEKVLEGWIWEILCHHRVPETRADEFTRTWLLDVDSLDLCAIFPVLIDSAGVSPFAVAIKLQQVTREMQPPGLDCLGSKWIPAMKTWALQGRFRVIGLPPHSWVMVCSSAWVLTALFSN